MKALRCGRSFAGKVMATILSWSTSKPPISATMHVSVANRLAVFNLRLGDSDAYSQTIDHALVDKLIARAKEIAPKSDPLAGDLAVFDGKTILVFRRFHESFSRDAAVQCAKELAGYILINGKPR